MDSVERKAPVKPGEKLFHFLAGLLLEKFYGTVTIRFEAGKVTHVEAETRRMWQYKDLPGSGAICDTESDGHDKREYVSTRQVPIDTEKVARGNDERPGNTCGREPRHP